MKSDEENEENSTKRLCRNNCNEDRRDILMIRGLGARRLSMFGFPMSMPSPTAVQRRAESVKTGHEHEKKKIGVGDILPL